MTMKITFRELTVFYYIVKYTTVQTAADKLNITQSAASQALLKLENSLDTSLFDRNGRQLILNENGRLLLPFVLDILNSAQSIETLFKTNPIALKVGTSTTIGNYIMPQKLAEFRTQYPSSKLDMMVANTDTIIAAVANFSIDIGIIEGNCTHQDVLVKPWQDDELVMFSAYSSSTNYMTHEQLSQLPWLLREKGSGTRAIVEQFLNKQLGHFWLNMELGNSEAIKYAVAAGLGVSCLSRYVIDDLLQQQKVSLLNCSLPVLTRKFSIITHRNKKYTQGIQSLLAVLG